MSKSRKRPVGKCGRTLYMTETGQRVKAQIYHCDECPGYHLAKDKKPRKGR